MAETLADLGEFELIDRLRSRIGSHPAVAVGPGDDAAVVTTQSQTLAAADILVEGVHFDLALSSPTDAGFKAMAVNVSDIAAMGGVARYALVSLAAPAITGVRTVEAIYDGLLAACAEFGVEIVGGDTSSAPQITIAVTVLGDPGPGATVLRSGARAGDLVCVTGALGAAAAGLSLLRIATYDPQAAALLDREPGLAPAHSRPQIRAAAGPRLGSAGVSAMIDVSDGFARDAGHIAAESGTGMRIDAAALPVAKGVAEAGALLGIEPAMMAAAGGDDYELAFTVARAALPAAQEAAKPVPVTVVGEITGDASQRVLIFGSDATPLDGIGWEHFA